MDKQLVTVIIPTYNRFYYLHRAINSVLQQTWKNIEIIVVNDCSTQPEYKELNELYIDNPKVKILNLEKNLREVHNSKCAQGMTRNKGILIAKGEWIAFLDDDDFFITKDKIQEQIKAMEMYNVKASCSNMVTGNGLNINTYNNVYFNIQIGTPINKKYSLISEDTIKTDNFINNSSVIIHKSVIDKAGLQKLIKAEDYEYWKECIKHTNFIYLNECTIGYDFDHGGGIFYS